MANFSKLGEDMTYAEIIKKLEKRLSGKRFSHSMGVAETAVALAKRFGSDVDKARLAGILHDCAREVPSNTLLQTAEASGIVLCDIERLEPVLIHAKLGARMAQAEYGVTDADILQAIALHTTGGPVMTPLDKIIFLADFIEPGRDYPGVDALRLLAKTDLNRAVLAACDQTISFLLEERRLLHPATIEGRNALLTQMRI